VAQLFSLGGITLYERHNHYRSYGSHYVDSWLWQKVTEQFSHAAAGTGRRCFIRLSRRLDMGGEFANVGSCASHLPASAIHFAYESCSFRHNWKRPLFGAGQNLEGVDYRSLVSKEFGLEN
jgi:hypothetical protein